MNNTIFIVESAGYSTELLSYYLEKETQGEVIHFFHPDEIFSYKKLVPSIIIFCQNDSPLESEFYQSIYNRYSMGTTFINLQGNYIEILGYEEGEKSLKITASMVASNIYLSTIDLCQKILNGEAVNH